MTDKGIHTAFTSDQTFEVEIFTEDMDLTRFRHPGYKEALARFLEEKYSAVKPDLIITMFPSALSFVLNYCDRVFCGVPIVASSLFESSAKELEWTDARVRTTGVILKGDIGATVSIARGLRPGLRRIALVCGTACELDKSFLAIVRSALKQHEPEIEVLDIVGLAMPQIIERVSSLPPDSVILYVSILIDGNGQHFVPRQALKTISLASNVPVFGLPDSFLGYGIVGGSLVSFEAHGRVAAELAIRILAGESPGDIPFSEYDTTARMFDWRELKRWGISENLLPPGSIVKFKPPSIWQEYRGVVFGGVCFIVIETLLVIGLFVNLHKRKRAEVKIREGEKDLQDLTGRLIWAQEEERRRLARDLHDDLTQRLAVLAIQTGRMEQGAKVGRQPMLKEFHDLRDQAIQISTDIHNISRQIHPSILDDLGLEKAIESECTRFSNREGLEVVFTADGIPRTLPKDVALSIYRIIQEGLTNIAKHACARHATVSLKGYDHGLWLSVRDDGIGFDAAELKKRLGLGLSSMRERVRIIQGRLRIQSEPEKGTTIEVNVPLQERGTKHGKDLNGGDDLHEDNS